LHSTSSITIPLSKTVPEVHTLYDMAVIRYPERFRRWQRIAGTRRLRHLKSKRKILCISRFTADEAMALTGLPASRFEVTHLGCSLPASEEVPPFHLPQAFFLFVGSLEPGKNLALLKQVYELAQAKDLEIPPLLIVGARWQGVRGEGAPPRSWTYLGHLPDEILVYLYRRAAALVFPSKYEGFGLPVAEAMAQGCPVICSPVASIPEVAGKAASYAPLDARSYLDAMRRIVTDDEWRGELVSRGKVQATHFSWAHCAKATADAYFSL
jgi:alpha-1,3-rhamnosyl/mannosyltransferase